MKPKVSPIEDIISYLSIVKSDLEKLKIVVASKNKTLKIKAFANIVDVFHARATTAINYAKSGGMGESSIITQKMIYDDVIVFLIQELSQ